MRQPQVLIVDDNQLWLDFISRQLDKAGCQVIAHTNSLEAIDDITAEIDLIVVDLLLGYNSIFPLLHELRSDLEISSVPVVVCSSIAGSIPDGSLDSYGVKAVLDKTTMTPADIQVVIKRILA